ncbi:hypothetical protein EV182_001500 [Spiromyces aspiralis]|uniref:Uncharacterized protein n=1 Tax=Spiromyces aspiralis TaxID=68401 RepID=A0ACC1HG48_9FUNG|nr:hypothetical protein EV182_001500 [Spiromyces aspiralis]
MLSSIVRRRNPLGSLSPAIRRRLTGNCPGAATASPSPLKGGSAPTIERGGQEPATASVASRGSWLRRVAQSAGEYAETKRRLEQALQADGEGSYSLTTKLTNLYYDIMAEQMEHTWGESFHFARKATGESNRESIRRHEHFLFSMAQIRPRMKVLDVGCGIGGPARECVRMTGAHVTGLNISDYQLQRARDLTARCDMVDSITFVKGDFMAMPFVADSFDAVYAIEALAYAPSLVDAYHQVYRVLKPGGCFATYEICLTDKYNHDDPRHRKAAQDVAYGWGFGKLHHTSDCVEAARAAGFEQVTFAQDMAAHMGAGNDIPWYNDFSNELVDFSSFHRFLCSRVSRAAVESAFWAAERLGMAPKGSTEFQRIATAAVQGMVEGGKMGIFTPMFMVVAQKAHNSSPLEV